MAGSPGKTPRKDYPRTQYHYDDSVKILDVCNGRLDEPAPTNPVRLALAVLDLLDDPRTQGRREEIAKVADRLASMIRY